MIIFLRYDPNVQPLSMSTSPPTDLTKSNFTESTCIKTTMVQNPGITISRQTLTINNTGVFIDNDVQNAWGNQ